MKKTDLGLVLTVLVGIVISPLYLVLMLVLRLLQTIIDTVMLPIRAGHLYEYRQLTKEKSCDEIMQKKD